jgi:putative ABC transport system permease protein
LDEMYIAETKLNMLFNIFSIMTILIACLGLLGLTSFVTEQRTKETGVRKIMGASARQLIWLLNKDFLLLVLLSNIISWPIAYLFMNKWIHGFAYRMDFGLLPFRLLTIVPFISELLIIIFIAVITISFFSLKAALVNPIKSLSQE